MKVKAVEKLLKFDNPSVPQPLVAITCRRAVLDKVQHGTVEQLGLLHVHHVSAVL